MNKLRKTFPLLVIVALIAVCFWNVMNRRAHDEEPGVITLRVGHWLLHTGMRESFDEAAAEYSRLNPGVRVEQAAVPIRVWPAWLRTQLTGGTAPDITGLLHANEELVTRYFLPLDPWIDEPNPYNVGTPLEGQRWRDTFVDGLSSMRYLTPTNGGVSAAYLQLNTLRLFYNRDLLREITGSDQVPEDYAALSALGPQVVAYNASRQRQIVPIASCGPYAPYLFNILLPSQTQKLARELSPMPVFRVSQTEIAARMLEGSLSYRTPEFASSLSLLRDVTSLMPPGYGQLQRDDALFTFLQGNAVAIAAGSWDYAVLRQQSGFGIKVGYISLPAPHDPVYGRYVVGPAAESGGNPEGAMGIVRTCAHPEQALDFLRFLTSHRVASRFSERAHRISAVREIPAPSGAPQLAPRLDGEANGFPIDFVGFGARHAYQAFHRNLHLLTSSTGGIDAFTMEMQKTLPADLHRDMEFHLQRTRQNIRRLDARLALLLTSPEQTAPDDGAWTATAENRDLLLAELLDLSSRFPASP